MKNVATALPAKAIVPTTSRNREEDSVSTKFGRALKKPAERAIQIPRLTLPSQTSSPLIFSQSGLRSHISGERESQGSEAPVQAMRSI